MCMTCQSSSATPSCLRGAQGRRFQRVRQRLIEKMVQVQLSQEKIDAINEKLLEVIDVQLADARKQLESAEAQIEAGRKEYDRQFKNYNKTVSDTVMQQFSGQVGEAVETVRKQAQALLDSVNQLIAWCRSRRSSRP